MENMKIYNALVAAKLAGDTGGGGGNIASSNVTAMTGYAKAKTAADISTSDSLNATMGKVEKRVSDNENNILLYQPTYEKYEYTVTNINTYEYTGVSFTVLASQVVDFTVCYQYNGGDTTFNPSICVADNSTNIGNNSTIIAENTQENSQTGKSYWCLQLNGITPRRSSNTTYYIWVKSGNATTNHICLMKRRIE